MADGTAMGNSDFDYTRHDRLKPLSLVEIRNLPPRKCLIKGLLGVGEMSVWYGDPGCGKSFLMLDLARRIAMACEWHGRRVIQGPTLYVMCEGGSGAGKRVEAMSLTYDMNEDTPLHIIPASTCLLDDPDDLAGIIFWANQTGASLIIIDTLNRAFGGGDENNSADMGKFIRNCDAIREATGAHVAVVHHNGSNNEKRGRGHTSLEGAADTMVLITKKGSNLTAKVTKNKDDEDGWSVDFELKVIQLGADEDGDPVTSCAVVPADANLNEETGTKRLTGDPRIAMDALEEALIENGKTSNNQNGIPNGSICVHIDIWRSVFYSMKDGEQEAKKKAFQRANKSLRDKSRIAYRDGLVWIVRDTGTNRDKTGQCPDMSRDITGHTP
jgi:hypothetical protein